MKVVVRSPEPFLFHKQGQTIGVLVIHGFTGSTAELRPLGEFLFEKGWSVYAPLLRGHGTSPEDMKHTTWVDWWESAREGYHRLKQAGCKHIVVVGLSMGGLLAIKIAQYQPVLGVVTLCSPLVIRDKRLFLARYLQYVVEYKKRSRKKAEHIEKELYPYEKTPLTCVVSIDKLMKNVALTLPYMEVPALIVQATKDETVDPCSGQMIHDQWGHKEKEIVHFHQSSHIITLDKEREKLFDLIHDFIQHQTSTFASKEQGKLLSQNR